MKSIFSLQTSFLDAKEVDDAFMAISGVGEQIEDTKRISFRKVKEYIVQAVADHFADLLNLPKQHAALDQRVGELQDAITATAPDSLPSGCIVMWSGKTPPEGWLLCNGENDTPDLTGRFIMGANGYRPIGTRGGNILGTSAVSVDPVLPGMTATVSQHEATSTLNVQMPDRLLPPYHVLAYIMKA